MTLWPFLKNTFFTHFVKIFLFFWNILKPSTNLETFADLRTALGTAFGSSIPPVPKGSVSQLVVGLLDGSNQRNERVLCKRLLILFLSNPLGFLKVTRARHALGQNSRVLTSVKIDLNKIESL